jgi:hypothetical protein
MSEPVAFISRLAVKEGLLEAVRPMWREAANQMDSGKPGTLVFLSFLDESKSRITVLHVFGDAHSMDAHFEGSDERARMAYEYVTPLGWEIYGRPSEAAVENLRAAAASAGVSFTIYPEFVTGFLHAPM